MTPDTALAALSPDLLPIGRRRPRITAIRPTTVAVPLEAPLRTANGVHWGRFVRTLVEVDTDDHGNFITTFPVSRIQRSGPTTLVAQVANGPSASQVVDVARVRRARGASGLD